MVNYKKIIYALIVCITSITIYSKNHLTFEPWKHGRLGDQIWNICKSLMLADKYSLPFIMKPFNESEHFPIHRTIDNAQSENNIVRISHETDIETNLEKDVLFLSHFYTKPKTVLYNYCLENKEFQKKLTALFTPNIITNINLPNNKITVGMHIRKGSNTDTATSSLQEYYVHENEISYTVDSKEIPVASAAQQTSSNAMDKRYPIKFPPNQYYIEALKKFSELVHHQPLYVHVFTDSKNPEELLEQLKTVNLSNVEWHIRNNKEKHNNTLISDFAQMTKFNCLIRPDSSFSKVIQLIGNYTTIIYPIHGTWYDNKLLIDTVGIIWHKQPPF